MKTAISALVNEDKLLLPERLKGALAANDRIKYLFALLQAARSHADDPAATISDLRDERRLCGIDDEALDDVVPAARRGDDGGYVVPGAPALLQRVHDELDRMLAPLHISAAGGLTGIEADRRAAAAFAALPPLAGDVIPGELISAVTAARRGTSDSLHLLVMDAHKALNRLQATLATETIDGATTYGLTAADRPLVAAFMRGVNRTARLKFDHPGLDTFATRTDDRLIIQNDIGTSDAHVLVVNVTGAVASLTYTDVHRPRLEFFQSLLPGVTWNDVTTHRLDGARHGGDAFVMRVGRYEARDAEELADYLSRLGSRIVFLIDWNKARKQLELLVRRSDAIELLRWAADHDLGHRGFLSLGGGQLIVQAIEAVSRIPIRFGQNLADVLGREAACAYLRFVLNATAEGLLAGRSASLIRDEVRVELLNHFRTATDRLLDFVAEHAVLIWDSATTLRDGMLRLAGGSAADLKRDAERVKGWESRADAIVVTARDLIARSSGTAAFRPIIEAADDVADELEEAAFHLGLAAEFPRLPEALLPPLQRLAQLLVECTQAFVRGVEAARHIHRGGARSDIEDFLAAVDRIIEIEHATDAAQRRLTASLVTESRDFRELYLLAEIARDFERAADRFMRAALLLRDHILSDVMAA
jgi:uncharacterized protein Yka (UPF0111/DUF47 family)